MMPRKHKPTMTPAQKKALSRAMRVLGKVSAARFTKAEQKKRMRELARARWGRKKGTGKP